MFENYSLPGAPEAMNIVQCGRQGRVQTFDLFGQKQVQTDLGSSAQERVLSNGSSSTSGMALLNAAVGNWVYRPNRQSPWPPFASEYCIFSLVGFKGNLWLLVCFLSGLKQMEVGVFTTWTGQPKPSGSLSNCN